MKVETPRSCTSPRTHGPLALGFVATLLLASAARDGLAQSPPAAPTSTEQTPPAATAPTSTAPASTASTAPAATAPAASTAPASTAPTAPTASSAPASTTTAASTATAPASTALASTAPPPPAATAPAPAPTAAPAIVAEATPPPLPQVPPPFATPPVTTGMADIAGLVAKVRPSVVNITSTHQIRAPHFDFDWPFGPNPFGTEDGATITAPRRCASNRWAPASSSTRKGTW